MAMVKYRDCLASELSEMEIINGSLIVCRDTGDMIYDSLEGERVPIAKGAHKVSGKVNNELFPQEGHFYYSTDDRMVCVYHDGSFQPINVTMLSITLDNLMVLASGSETVEINPNSAGSKFVGVNGYILNVVGHTLNTDRSIIDLDNDFVAGGHVTFGTVSNNNGWSITINNAATMNWIGSANVLVIFQEMYNNVA